MLFVEIKIPHVQSANHVQLAMTSILRIVRKEKYIQAKERKRLLNRLLSWDNIIEHENEKRKSKFKFRFSMSYKDIRGKTEMAIVILL